MIVIFSAENQVLNDLSSIANTIRHRPSQIRTHIVGCMARVLYLNKNVQLLQSLVLETIFHSYSKPIYARQRHTHIHTHSHAHTFRHSYVCVWHFALNFFFIHLFVRFSIYSIRQWHSHTHKHIHKHRHIHTPTQSSIKFSFRYERRIVAIADMSQRYYYFQLFHFNS